MTASPTTQTPPPSQQQQPHLSSPIHLHPIGTVRSVFTTKNGSPRQGSLVPFSRAVLQLHQQERRYSALDGLQQFSHLWLIFFFHENSSNSNSNNTVTATNDSGGSGGSNGNSSSSGSGSRNVVRPPRLGGGKVGLFATRSPHRPNPIGLTLARIERVDVSRGRVHLSGVDLVNGTPVLDIKPYIPQYDSVAVGVGVHDDDGGESTMMRDSVASGGGRDNDGGSNTNSNSGSGSGSDSGSNNGDNDDNDDGNNNNNNNARVPEWVHRSSSDVVCVEWSERALAQLRQWVQSGALKLFDADESEQVRQLVDQVLLEDPRSVYRRRKCGPDPYWFHVDDLNIEVRFVPLDDSQSVTRDYRGVAVKAVVQGMDIWPDGRPPAAAIVGEEEGSTNSNNEL